VERSFKYHRPHGIFGIGSEEPNALMQIGDGGGSEPNIRATQIDLFDGLVARSQNNWPSLRWDVAGVLSLLGRFLPAGFYYKTFIGRRVYGPAGGFAENIGIDLPGATNHAIKDGDQTARCLAPGEWLLVGERPDLGSQVENAGGTLSDLRHARVVFRMPANLGREVLAKGCPLDLRPEIFQPGRCAQSVLAGVAILVHHLPTGDDMDIYVARSYGRFIHDWLVDATSR